MDNEQREEVKARILDAVNRLRAERGQGGLDSSRRREAALLDGVRAIADWHGVPLQPIGHFDSRGEVMLSTVPSRAAPEQSQPGWGVGFAADLARVQWRTGTVPMQGVAPLPDSKGAWAYLGHFAAEALIYSFAKDLETGQRPLIDALYDLLERTGGYVRRTGVDEATGDRVLTIWPGRNAAADLAIEIEVPAWAPHANVEDNIADLEAQISRALERARVEQRGPGVTG